MADFKSVQELIIKAAMYDGISTTIRPMERFGGYNVIELVFSKGNNFSAIQINTNDCSIVRNPEDAVLYACKGALKELFMEPYRDIQVINKE